jgi:hypothetical protein
MRHLLLLLACAALTAADLTGTWIGDKPLLAADATLVIAIYDRTGTCCGGPPAALAGLANLRDTLKERSGVRLIAVDSTPGATVELATAAVTEFKIAGIPILVDPARATGTALGVEGGMTMRYVVRKKDGTSKIAASPAQVRKALAE